MIDWLLLVLRLLIWLLILWLLVLRLLVLRLLVLRLLIRLLLIRLCTICNRCSRSFCLRRHIIDLRLFGSFYSGRLVIECRLCGFGDRI